MVLQKVVTRAKKIGGDFFVFQNKVISKKIIILGGPPSWCYYEEMEQYFALGGHFFDVF